MTGFGASASLLGQPDVGLLSFAEMADQARRLAEAVDVPLIADADDGYGNPINVARTVRAYEAAGVAGLHLEDQLSPKRCGHLEGKQLIAASEMVEKVRAAVEARRSADLVIIARTDARARRGLDAALERARRYRDAGADVLFVEAPESEAEVAAVAQAFPDTPLLFNAVEGGRTPLLELARLRELGFRLVLCPLTALLAATAASSSRWPASAQRHAAPTTARCPSRTSPTSSGCRRSSASKPVSPPLRDPDLGWFSHRLAALSPPVGGRLGPVATALHVAPAAPSAAGAVDERRCTWRRRNDVGGRHRGRRRAPGSRMPALPAARGPCRCA
jgi:2-methylisocitrate lyase-like PEP mutase family enzyme